MVLSLILLACTSATAAAAGKPNIVLLFADQLLSREYRQPWKLG